MLVDGARRAKALDRYRLTHVLADLYDTGVDVRRLAFGAGLGTKRITLTGSALDMWSSVVEEADKLDMLPAILRIAHEEYPNNAALDEAVKAINDEKPSGGGSLVDRVGRPGPWLLLSAVFSLPVWIALLLFGGLPGPWPRCLAAIGLTISLLPMVRGRYIDAWIRGHYTLQRAAVRGARVALLASNVVIVASQVGWLRGELAYSPLGAQPLDCRTHGARPEFRVLVATFGTDLPIGRYEERTAEGVFADLKQGMQGIEVCRIDRSLASISQAQAVLALPPHADVMIWARQEGDYLDATATVLDDVKVLAPNKFIPDMNGREAEIVRLSMATALRLSETLVVSDRYDEAERLLSYMLDVHKEFESKFPGLWADVYAEIGEWNMFQLGDGDYQVGLEWMLKALAADPCHQKAQLNATVAYQKLGRIREMARTIQNYYDVTCSEQRALKLLWGEVRTHQSQLRSALAVTDDDATRLELQRALDAIENYIAQSKVPPQN